MTKGELLKQLQFCSDADNVSVSVMNSRTGDLYEILSVSIDEDDPDNKLIFLEVDTKL